MEDNSTYRMMYMDALIGLENGHLMPWDRDLLASSPLPSSVIDPYTSREMPDVLESMKLTFNAMSIWVDEAKKVNYFSKRFVQLSRMVMNGVTTIGRGLVTLHARGEDLSQSPMSIQDLLGVASYHFRKSYLGVLQTSRSHPEIGERLLMNQIGWNNMLMRLFKTIDKLAEPSKCKVHSSDTDRLENRDQGSVASCQLPVVSGQCSCCKDHEPHALPDTSDLLVQALSRSSRVPEFKPLSSGISAPSAIREPGALTAPRAFSSFDAAPAVERKNEEGRTKDSVAANILNDAESNEKQLITDNGDCPFVGLPTQTNEDGTVPEEEAQAAHDTGDSPMKGQSPGEEPMANEDGDSLVKRQSPEESPTNLPPYLQIMQNVFARGQSAEGALTFTYEELCYLAVDQDFNRIYPDQAAQMRSILHNMDNS